MANSRGRRTPISPQNTQSLASMGHQKLSEARSTWWEEPSRRLVQRSHSYQSHAVPCVSPFTINRPSYDCTSLPRPKSRCQSQSQFKLTHYHRNLAYAPSPSWPRKAAIHVRMRCIAAEILARPVDGRLRGRDEKEGTWRHWHTLYSAAAPTPARRRAHFSLSPFLQCERVGVRGSHKRRARSCPHPSPACRFDAYAGSASRLAIMSLNAGRAWQAASHAFTRGTASNASGAPDAKRITSARLMSATVKRPPTT